MVREVELALYLTAAFLGAAGFLFALTVRQAARNHSMKGANDFRVQMSVVAFIWLGGEVVDLFAPSEVGRLLHAISMLLFAGFVIIRARYVFGRSPSDRLAPPVRE